METVGQHLTASSTSPLPSGLLVSMTSTVYSNWYGSHLSVSDEEKDVWMFSEESRQQEKCYREQFYAYVPTNVHYKEGVI